jgi:hypothetical protein
VVLARIVLKWKRRNKMLRLSDPKVGGRYWMDTNGNKWNANDFKEDRARRLSKTLENCIDCTDCSHCTDCIDCTKCIGCSNCTNCTNLVDDEHKDRCGGQGDKDDLANRSLSPRWSKETSQKVEKTGKNTVQKARKSFDGFVKSETLKKQIENIRESIKEIRKDIDVSLPKQIKQYEDFTIRLKRKIDGEYTEKDREAIKDHEEYVAETKKEIIEKESLFVELIAKSIELSLELGELL